MGGHGGLNILPQKRWNVYNYDNREKVRLDEEAAAREEQLKLEQSRRCDAEFRLEKLRQARGLSNSSTASAATASAATAASATATASAASASASATTASAATASAVSVVSTVVTDSGHFNLFDGLKDFAYLSGDNLVTGSNEKEAAEKEAADVDSNKSNKKRRGDAPVKVAPEDEKYKLGYGLIGKGVKAPWYASKPSLLSPEVANEGADVRKSSDASASGSGKKGRGKKTIEELREERMKREKQEKERERSLLALVGRKQDGRGFSRMRV